MLLMYLAACGLDVGLGAGDGADGTGVEPVGDNGPPEPPDESDAFFAEGTLYDFHISIPDESRSSLASAPKTWVPATFSAENQTWPVMLRLKGTTTFRPLSGKAAFKIDFHADDPDVRFHGLKRLTLNSMLQDSSMLHEHVAYWLFRHRGILAPRHTYARVDVDGTPYGLYGVVETMDEQLLKRYFPDDHDGNLYEANLADFTEADAPRFELEESGEEFEPVTDLAAVGATLDAATPADWMDSLAEHFDVDMLLDTIAIDLVSGNVDGYSRLRNNYLAWHGSDGWRLVPWGFDQSFQFHRSVNNWREFPGTISKRCGDSPDCVDRLYGAIRDLMDDWQTSDLLPMAAEAANLIQADCRADPRAEIACDVGHVMPFLLDRPGTVAEDLGDAP